MAKRKLDNLTFIVDGDFDNPFMVSGYTFCPQDNQKFDTGKVSVSDNIKHKQNAYVEFKGKQKNSVIFRGGRVGVSIYRSQERKFLEDLLLIGSILTARNWNFFSRRNSTKYPVVSRNHLEYISKDATECEKHMKIAVSKLENSDWQKQFENGFHLVMLLNHANILNDESRFIAMMVIWEWLYPHLKNPAGATPSDESNNLKEIIYFILNNYWTQKVDVSLKSSNIFHVLRNQLAHSGKLPINRKYAEPWMTQLKWPEIQQYLRFFDHLTQIVVLKTLNIDGENSLKVFNFQEKLDKFLQTGKII